MERVIDTMYKKSKYKKLIVCSILLIIAIVAPFAFTSEYNRHIMVMCGVWIIAALGLNLILGYVGQLNLAHGTFFGVGAYATALLMQKAGIPFWWALPLGCLATAALGFVTGIPTLRTRGHYFPIATMCLGIAVYYAIARWDDFTGGACGLYGIPRPGSISLPLAKTIDFESTVACYYLVLLIAVLTIILMLRLVKSLTGQRIMAVRGNEDLAQSLGINTMKDKIVCFTLSTVFAGLAGGIFASYVGAIMPENAHFLVSFEMLLYVMIGGVGTIAGPVIGAILIPVLSEILHFMGSLRLVIFGFILILTIQFLPFGIIGGIRVALLRYPGLTGRSVGSE